MHQHRMTIDQKDREAQLKADAAKESNGNAE